MNPKVRVALALSLLLVLLTALAADAGPTASVTVGSWSYCPSGTAGYDVIRATDVSVKGVRKPILDLYLSNALSESDTYVSVVKRTTSLEKTASLNTDPTVQLRARVDVGTTNDGWAVGSDWFYITLGEYSPTCPTAP